ncbi:MAG: 4Fe-4S binding protein [Eubacteriaceae bacterium]|nr:4Fe-4S binding protein [Eubacteriaceae bacterium]
MIRKIIKIDEGKCNGCGLCATACHEGAIGMVNGKAKLLRDDFCDGLGDCLPACPTGAISFEEREAAAYDEAAVKANMAAKAQNSGMERVHAGGGCPGSRMAVFNREEAGNSCCDDGNADGADAAAKNALPASQLRQWPVQIKLAPVNAPYFNGAKLLVAADCTAYAFAGFHEKFIKNHITLVGCPKLDDVDYSEKLTEIIRNNDIQSVHVVRMEVPCCGGIENAVKKALMDSGKFIPWQVTTISISGEIIETTD